MKTAIGAYATIQWKDTKDIVEGCYISFGGDTYGEDETDAFGVPDINIFYFCDQGEEELKEFMTDTFEFRVLDYDLKYKDIQNELRT